LQNAVSRRQRVDRYQHILHFALHVGRPFRAASKSRATSYRLARTLVSDAMHHDDGNAIGRAHRLITINCSGIQHLFLSASSGAPIPAPRQVNADALGINLVVRDEVLFAICASFGLPAVGSKAAP
jgi:hypothetical protein